MEECPAICPTHAVRIHTIRNPRLRNLRVVLRTKEAHPSKIRVSSGRTPDFTDVCFCDLGVQSVLISSIHEISKRGAQPVTACFGISIIMMIS